MTQTTRLPLPLTFDDIELKPESLSGYQYPTGFPTAMQAMLLGARSQFTGFTQDKTVIYFAPFLQRVWASKGKAWLPGARLLAALYDAGGVPVLALLQVYSYNDLTGELWFQMLYGNVVTPNLSGKWLLTAQFADTILSTPLAIASGGTGASDLRTARNAIGAGMVDQYRARLYDDFVGSPEATFRNYTGSAGSGVINVEGPSYIASPDLINHPGCAILTVNTSSATSERTVSFPIDFRVGFFPGTDTFFEANVYVPVLSNVTDTYILRIGAGIPLGFGNSLGSNSFGYLTLKYTNAVNAGNWTTSYRTFSGGEITSNTAVAVVAATWYKIRVTHSGTNKIVTLNGSTVLTLADAGNIFQNVNNLGVQMIKLAGTTPVSAYVDYMYYRQQTTR
jgi:hypothetical protein